MMKTVTFKIKTSMFLQLFVFQKILMKTKHMQPLYVRIQLVAVKNKLLAQSMVKNSLKLGLLL